MDDIDDLFEELNSLRKKQKDIIPLLPGIFKNLDIFDKNIDKYENKLNKHSLIIRNKRIALKMALIDAFGNVNVAPRVTT